MREFFSSVILFLAFALVFSNFTGCSSSVQSDDSPVAEAPGSGNSANTAKKKSDYPPIATAIAQSDIKNLDGTTFKVADKKGKVILLNLWATWCGPCRSEMPTLVRLQERHRDAGLEVVGLNTDDETLEQINEFVADMKLNYTIAWADTQLQAALLNITKFPGIPQSFIIDRDGNLRGVFKGAARADVAKMEELVDMVVTGKESTDMPAAVGDAAPPSEGKQDTGKAVPGSDEATRSDSKHDSGKPDPRKK